MIHVLFQPLSTLTRHPQNLLMSALVTILLGTFLSSGVVLTRTPLRMLGAIPPEKGSATGGSSVMTLLSPSGSAPCALQLH